jgi:hypothetical protein
MRRLFGETRLHTPWKEKQLLSGGRGRDPSASFLSCESAHSAEARGIRGQDFPLQASFKERRACAAIGRTGLSFHVRISILKGSSKKEGKMAQ